MRPAPSRHETNRPSKEYRTLLRRLECGIRDTKKLLTGHRQPAGIWIDVGAHLGETTFQYAQDNPALRVFAFEPNWSLARQMMGRLANFVVLPMAVSERNGLADFFVNAADAASSLLPFNEQGLQKWIGGEVLKVESRALVPTIRLDTFMTSLDIPTVDYLKIDAQGADFSVIQSTGSRLKDIRKICLEADVNPVRLYQGSATRDEIVAYLQSCGFALVAVDTQSFGQEQNLTFVRSE